MTGTYLNLSLKVAPKLDRLRKKLNAIFDNEGLKSLLTQIYCNLFPCTEKYYPYRKPSDRQLYRNVKCTHPETVLKQLRDWKNTSLIIIYQ